MTTNANWQISPSSETFRDGDGEYYQASKRQDRRRKKRYHERPFLALDGEGITPRKSLRQSYVLLGASDGGSVSEEISSKQLSSAECLQFIIDLEKKYPSHIKVGFGISYDVNMIVRDIPVHLLERLLEGKWTSWRTFKIQWIAGKWFNIRQGDTTAQVFDVVSFFPSDGSRGGFAPAVAAYLDVEDDTLRHLVDMKATRGAFRYRDLDTKIRPYMRLELDLLCQLMAKLRELIVDHLELPLLTWHGPGAIGSALLTKHKIREHRPDEDDPDVRQASQFAYFGGRFETFRTGLYDGPVYSYDLNGAYPWALRSCPALDTEYHHDTDPVQGRPVPPFSLHRVRFYDTAAERTGFNPLPLRTGSGALFFPNLVETWAWGPEVNATLRHRPDALEIVESVTFNDDGRRPFDFLDDMYARRLEWKDAGHPAERVAKIGYNSIYGKLAQRAGWKDDGGAPHWHQLRWAGFITSMIRAAVYEAMMQAPDRIIAVETDGIFSEVPLDLPLGRAQGQWKVDQFDAIMYLQSGVYFALEGDSWATGKTRGFSRNDADARTALRSVQTLEPLWTPQTRFHGLRSSIGTDDWLKWSEHLHVITWGGAGKRYHPSNCPDCRDGSTWHRTVFGFPKSFVSAPHHLPWLGKRGR